MRKPLGNQVHFQANPACPIYEDLRNILKKTVGVADVLRAALAPLAPGIRAAFVYGSVARGEERAASDIDLMVVGEARFADVVAALQAALAAVLANGYRPSTSEPGHHQLLLQTLPKTIDLARVHVLEAFRKARNQSDHRGVPVSDAMARECAEHAQRLLAEVRGWIDARRKAG